MEGSDVLVLHCKASDFDASTGQCAAPFWGPQASFVPQLSYADAWILMGEIAACWAIGFLVKEARRPTKY